MEFKIINLQPEHFTELLLFTDQFIGKDYYSLEQINEIYEKSLFLTNNCSFLLFQNNQLKGIRLSYMPTKWHSVKGTAGLSPDKWEGISIKQLGYFQSLFIHPDLTKQHWGPVLSNLSLQEMQKAGALGVLTHCWMESPHNSSRRYLEKLGFNLIQKHNLYWHKVDYECPCCGKPCVCTAGEMLKVMRAK